MFSHYKIRNVYDILIHMLSDHQKYKSDVLKISGFALITPFGNLLVNPSVFNNFQHEFYKVYLTIIIILTIFGILSLRIGYNLYKKEGAK